MTPGRWLGLFLHRAMQPLWGLALAAAAHSEDVQVPNTAQPHLLCCTQRIQHLPFTAGASCATLQTGYCPQPVEFCGVFFKVSLLAPEGPSDSRIALHLMQSVALLVDTTVVHARHVGFLKKCLKKQ